MIAIEYNRHLVYFPCFFRCSRAIHLFLVRMALLMTLVFNSSIGTSLYESIPTATFANVSKSIVTTDPNTAPTKWNRKKKRSLRALSNKNLQHSNMITDYAITSSSFGSYLIPSILSERRKTHHNMLTHSVNKNENEYEKSKTPKLRNLLPGAPDIRIEQIKDDRTQADQFLFEQDRLDQVEVDQSEAEENDYNESDNEDNFNDESDYDESDYDESDYDESDYDESDYDESDYDESDYEESNNEESNNDESDYDESLFEGLQISKTTQNELGQNEVQASELQKFEIQEVDESPNFVPLQCNSKIFKDQNHVCSTSWTKKYGTGRTFQNRIIVPCGECIVMDLTNTTLAFQNGIDIIGKLVIESRDSNTLKIVTPLIIVQGELLLTSQKPVNGKPSIEFIMTGEKVLTYWPYGENSARCGTPESGSQGCVAGMKAIVVAGGRLNIRGIPPETPTWVKIVKSKKKRELDDGGYVDRMNVPSTILGKWNVGSEVLITSNTAEWNNQQVRRIQSIQRLRRNDRIVRILLDQPIRRPTTVSHFATEVALLSRNILWTSSARRRSRSRGVHGGHMMIFQTPTVQQFIEGIEIHNFGQQQNLGRYPIHFHFCNSVKGSVVSKNTIRQSNQRCIVVHGTDDLLIQENIAYDTKGHCFMTEDGIETGNQFVKNLGALTRKQNFIILDDDTDDDPATFWITNPRNSFYGNVAAGSESSGYWIEPLKRGARQFLYPHLNPKFDPLTLFDNNVAHSNADVAVKTYPKGYTPGKYGHAIFSRMTIYRNKRGMFIHGSTRIIVQDSLFADNAAVGIDVDKSSDGTVLNNTIVIGHTNQYLNQLSIEFKNNTNTIKQNVCNFNNEVFGIDLHKSKKIAFRENTQLLNVTVSGFDTSPCGKAFPLSMTANKVYKRYPFDTFPTLNSVRIQQTNGLMNLCNKEDVKDIYLNLIDSSVESESELFRHASSNGKATGVLLSDDIGMQAFVNPSVCTNHADLCYSVCYNTCFTTRVFRIDAMETDNYKIKVCKKQSGGPCTTFDGYFVRFDSFRDESLREYFVHLPPGDFTASFVNDDNIKTWPNFVTTASIENSVCPHEYPDATITIEVPPVSERDCTQLLSNTNMDETNSKLKPLYWAQRDSMVTQFAPQQGQDKSNAIRVSSSDGAKSLLLTQTIDSRCLKEFKGRWFELKANIKLTSSQSNNKENVVPCKGSLDCPEIGIVLKDGYLTVPIAQAKSTSIITKDGYLSVIGYFQVPPSVELSKQAYFYIKSLTSSATNMYVDNASMLLRKDNVI